MMLLFVYIQVEVFYGTQYGMYDWLKKDSYVMENDLYVRIRRLRLILYDWFFRFRTLVLYSKVVWAV
jgi:hypothetical protein